jgi:hypothetical protein
MPAIFCNDMLANYVVASFVLIFCCNCNYNFTSSSLALSLLVVGRISSALFRLSLTFSNLLPYGIIELSFVCIRLMFFVFILHLLFIPILLLLSCCKLCYILVTPKDEEESIIITITIITTTCCFCCRYKLGSGFAI